MFESYNYFRSYNNDKEILDHKEFYKKFSNEKEFGGGHFNHIDHLIKNRFVNTFGHISNIVLRKMPKSILDIGCGAGVNLPLSKAYDFIDYYGIDYAENTLKHAKEIYPEVKFAEMDAFNLTFDERIFDIAIISSVLILYKKLDDRLALLANTKKVLKDDGTLVAIIWNDTTLLKWSIKLSRLVAKLKGIELPKDFAAVHLKENEASKMFDQAGYEVSQVIHTGAQYGALECTKYLNMGKYKRNFGKGEQEVGSEKKQNILEDLKESSKSTHLIKFFYFVSKYFPHMLSMISIYVLKKAD